MTNKIVALLPMKAHSSRVPGKNFRPLAGKPLFRWILDTLLCIDEIDSVVINTDARRILADNGCATNGRVLIRDRPEAICGDDVSMNRVIEDDLHNVPAQFYLMTHTTNPFLSAQTIRGALARFHEVRDKGAGDSLFTVNKTQTRFYRADGSAVNHDPDNLIPTQDLEPWFEENSCLYLFTAQSFAASAARIGQRPVLFEMDPLESVDIDTPDDWRHAELLAEAGFPASLQGGSSSKS